MNRITALALMAGTSAGLGLGAGYATAQTTGNRTINGNVTNSGTLVPGTATTAGVLTINGNFLQTASGILSVRLGSAGSPTDQVYVHGGSATLGGTLSIQANRDVETGKSFFLMQTDKGLTGNFATILFPNLGLFRSFSLLRDSYSAYGVVNRLSFTTAGTNANQIAAGSGLDLTVQSTATTSAFATARENIGYQTQAAAASQLSRISGEGNASVIVGAQVSAKAFGEALLRAADDGRGELKKKRKGGFSLWAQALGATENLADKATGVADTKASAYGGAAGFDYSFGRVLRLGMGAGYTSGDTKAATQGSKVTTNVTHIGLFAQVDTDFELALALGYGIVDNKIARITDSGSAASASGKGSTLSGRLQLTVPYRLMSGVRLAPYALFAYDRATRNAFTEVTNDIFGLNVLRRTAGTAEAQLGAKLGATFVNYSSGFLGDEARLVPELRLAFSHLTYAKPLLAQQSFINAPDGQFSVAGPKRDQEAGLAGLSVTLRLTSGFSGYLDYSARVNSQVNSTVLGGVRYVF